MAYSFAEISAAEIALRDADKPQLIAQALSITPTFVGWSTAGTVAAGDASATGFPAARALDGLCHLNTKPNATNGTWYLVFQFPSPGIEFDWWGYIGGNETVPAGGAVTLQIADNDNWLVPAPSNLITLTTAIPGTGATGRQQEDVIRHGAAAGTDANRYTNVEFLRVRFFDIAPFTPEAGELIIGRRRQLKHKARTPYDPETLIGEHADLVTAGGVRHRYTYNDGRRRMQASINPSEEPYLADIPAWFRTASRYGRSPFVWVEDPGTSPELWTWMMLDEPSLVYPVQDFVERTFDINAEEQGPERFYLEKE